MHEARADVLVVGAGPAGVAAASVAAEAGARVIVLDDNPAAGGQIWRRGPAALPAAAADWIRRLERSGAQVESGVTVVDASGPGTLFGQRGEEVFRYRADATILATGSRELFLPFPGWTLPGVVGAGGMQALVKGGWPVRGKRVVVAGSGPLLLAVAAYLRTAGAEVTALVEQAGRTSLAAAVPGLLFYPSKVRQGLGLAWSLRGIRRFYGAWPTRALGDGRVESVTVRSAAGETDIPCDALACGFGLIPETRLARLLGATVEEGAVVVDGAQRTTVPGLYAAGELTGVGGVDVALKEGLVAGAAAARAPERIRRAFRRARDREAAFATMLERAFRLRPELLHLADDDTIVCRCEDVRFGELNSFVDARDAKLKTRCGMGPCQGRVCTPALRLINGWGPDRVRQPLFPVPSMALAEIGAAQTREVQQ
jgi:NADPH-dependent 2,4-dienoyl-CoA reductase/sulfur reductase-like enzyme